jgi:hypothetical protein
MHSAQVVSSATILRHYLVLAVLYCYLSQLPIRVVLLSEQVLLFRLLLITSHFLLSILLMSLPSYHHLLGFYISLLSEITGTLLFE